MLKKEGYWRKKSQKFLRFEMLLDTHPHPSREGIKETQSNRSNNKIELLIIFICLFGMNNPELTAREGNYCDSLAKNQKSQKSSGTFLGSKTTDTGYGGVVLKFTGINKQFAFMTGGRGVITINNKFTLGGGGYGVANAITMPGSDADTNRLFKMGYGGIETGYLLFTGKKIQLGSSLLMAAGASFLQNKPKADKEELMDDDFKIFPVLEPAIYGNITLGKWLRLHAGVSYRYIHNTRLDYMADKDLRGFSCFAGLLFGKTD